MDSYKLSRNFFNFCYDHPEKIKPIHIAIYFFAIEHCNRLGNKKVFGFGTEMAKDAIGVKDWQTYIKAFMELVEWKFITLVEKSKNQYSANIISLPCPAKIPSSSLDNAFYKHAGKHLVNPKIDNNLPIGVPEGEEEGKTNRQNVENIENESNINLEIDSELPMGKTPKHTQKHTFQHTEYNKTKNKEQKEEFFLGVFDEVSNRLLEWCKTEKYFKDRYLDEAIETFNKLQEMEYTEDQIKKAIVNGRTGYMAPNFQNPEKLIAKNHDKVYYIDIFIELTGKEISKEEREQKRLFFEKESAFAVKHDAIPGSDYKRICDEIYEGSLSFLLPLPNQMTYMEYRNLRHINTKKGIDYLTGNLETLKRFPGKAKEFDSVYKVIRKTIDGGDDDDED